MTTRNIYSIRLLISFAAVVFFQVCASAQVTYPYPLQRFAFRQETKSSYIAYMDVKPATPNGRAIILFHGKNFSGYYWKDFLPMLAAKGYRVIVPDQPGWGRSGKPDLHYSFHMLALLNKLLLDSLHLNKVTVLGHSMGGMLAIRFALMYPSTTEKLILEDPIGLEDYKTFVPYKPIDSVYKKERAATYESYKKYQQTYYPAWRPEYEQYVAAQAEELSDPSFDQIAHVNAVTYEMIYEQPVIYELNQVKTPTLFIIGQADRTIVGKEYLNDEQRTLHGQYPELGRRMVELVTGGKLVELPGVGHIPHVQELDKFAAAVFGFL